MLISDNVVKIDPRSLVEFGSYLPDGIVGLERRRVGKLGAVISVVVRGESKRHWKSLHVWRVHADEDKDC